jgi:hypothetical protein
MKFFLNDATLNVDLSTRLSGFSNCTTDSHTSWSARIQSLFRPEMSMSVNMDENEFRIWLDNKDGAPCEMDIESFFKIWSWTEIHDPLWHETLKQTGKTISWTQKERARLISQSDTAMWCLRNWIDLYMEEMLDEVRDHLIGLLKHPTAIKILCGTKISSLMKLLGETLDLKNIMMLEGFDRESRLLILGIMMKSNLSNTLLTLRETNGPFRTTFEVMAKTELPGILENMDISIIMKKPSILDLFCKAIQNTEYTGIISNWLDRVLQENNSNASSIELVVRFVVKHGRIDTYSTISLMYWAGILLDHDTSPLHSILKKRFMRYALNGEIMSFNLILNDRDETWFRRYCLDVEMILMTWDFCMKHFEPENELTSQERVHRSLRFGLTQKWTELAKAILPSSLDASGLNTIATSKLAWEMATACVIHGNTAFRNWAFQWICFHDAWMYQNYDTVNYIEILKFCERDKENTIVCENVAQKAISNMLIVPELRCQFRDENFAELIVSHVEKSNLATLFMHFPEDTNLKLKARCFELIWMNRHKFHSKDSKSIVSSLKSSLMIQNQDPLSFADDVSDSKKRKRENVCVLDEI